MRILFIQAAMDNTSEYQVHRLLAESVAPDRVDCYFVWQDSHRNATRQDAPNASATHNFFYDFGRDMSLSPKPSKRQRALMMARQFPGALRFLLKVVRQVRPDVIYTSQQSYDLLLAGLVRRFYRVPHLIHVHYPVGQWLGQRTLKSIQQAPHLLAVSEYIRRQAIEAGVRAEAIGSLLNPVRLDTYSTQLDRATVRQEFGWSLDTPLVVALGRLDPGKGHELLLEAFTRVTQTLPTAQLLICGETSTRTGYDQQLKQKAAQLGLDKNVTWAGFRTDAPAIYAAADVFCLPTENEACALVFLEAAATGLPSVACRSGGVPELVIDGVTGLLSELEDAEALANHLLKLLSQPELAAQMGQAARRNAWAHHAADKVAARWADWLENRLAAPLPKIMAQAGKVAR